MLKQIVLKKLQVRIYLEEEYRFFCNSNKEWIYLENQNCLEKVYYSIPACNFTESLFFFSQNLPNNFERNQIQLLISLHCNFYDGTSVQAKGALNVNNKNSNAMSHSYDYETSLNNFHPISGISNIRFKVSNTINYIRVF